MFVKHKLGLKNVNEQVSFSLHFVLRIFITNPFANKPVRGIEIKRNVYAQKWKY